jgi:hypothetical protein
MTVGRSSLDRFEGRAGPQRRSEGEDVKRLSFVALLFATAGAVAVPSGTGAAPSCVGQFASTSATQDGRAFGADISFAAQFASQPNFGAGVVAPFAHAPRNACP